ncbi:conserved hypothetical protein [Neospora caninum Liverpool]|uniref:Uncharacterized protein n=1 Tax=Neospora caninum (strain Liverpool) TaxID=572307 RepID=F0V9C8_NEOCL|nr:conserved hypothetical protein [Neospora caninum Liverpool]CBZ50353.1 conserved hypothetical protein [Neospora caninum Liverpool]CEL64960.1 TPA: hypothetical protein BN1204_008240 [Neospora caninum Liverpool]|eukprot:XP_003880387.1 conserved hypothetical protein [Neospora caninum Liverpool]
MAAESPRSLDVKENSRASRASARRMPRLSGRWSSCRLPRIEVADEGSYATGAGVNPFAYNHGVGQPNPLLPTPATGVNGDACLLESAHPHPALLSVPSLHSRTTSSVSTPSSPRFLHPEREADSAFDSGFLGGDSVSGTISGPAKRRRSVHVDGSVQASESACASFSGFRASLRGGDAFDLAALSAGFPPSFPALSRPSTRVAPLDTSGQAAPGSKPSETHLPGGQSAGGGSAPFSVVVSSSKDEPEKPSPPVYIDSGCYSLCYHTSMTVPPPALSLGSLPTPSLDKDREARRRRKACMSVLRSVQSSLRSTPESSPNLEPLPEPQGVATSSFLSPAVSLPVPPPAVRQPFFPSAFQSGPSASSLCPSWSAHARRYSVASTSSRRSSNAEEPSAKGDKDGGGAVWSSLCHPGAGDSEASSPAECPSPAGQVKSVQELRLRPEWFSPCTLGTLIGACVHAYDEIRAAFPPPEPAPRTCLLSVPALYDQLPPHLKNGAVLLDADALALGTSPAFVPIECSECAGEVERGIASRKAEEASEAVASVNEGMSDMSSQGGDGKPSRLPAHLYGEFDIIVCDTKTVTVAAIENTAACIRALCRRRTPKIAGDGQQSESVDAAAEALSGLSLHGGGAVSSAISRGASALPPFCRVIMISTCLLSPVVDDLLGLRQSPFQPYIPSSALSSLQLQCIYSNVSTFPGLQKHNTVDFSTRVRVKSSAFRPHHSGAASRDAFSDGLSPVRRGTQEDGNEGGGEILGSDAMVARALVLQSEEEQLSSCLAQESGTVDLCGTDSPAEQMDERHESERQEARLLSEFNRLQLHGCPMAMAEKNGAQRSTAAVSFGFSGFLPLPSVQTQAATAGVQTGAQAAGHGKACRGITMRSFDDPTDDGIDYELECGSHFGMVGHDL